MKLIGSLTSPYVRKVRIVLTEKKIEFEFAIDSPWNADSNVPNVNPLGKVPVLILDDSVVKRNRSKSVELLARVYDHVEHKFQKGFTLLTLGWSDGYSFIPVGFNLLSSAKKSNRYNEISENI